MINAVTLEFISMSGRHLGSVKGNDIASFIPHKDDIVYIDKHKFSVHMIERVYDEDSLKIKVWLHL